ncbi:MAG: hypothetical protein KC414_14320, partial [Romboutsia sp.]|nr:hypothetical protein [Romboutsia sp.]
MGKFNKLLLYCFDYDREDRDFLCSLNEMCNELIVVSSKNDYTGNLNLLSKDDLVGVEAIIMRVFDNIDLCINNATSLKYIGVSHTDISDFNIELLNSRNITLRNIPGYSTKAVAELT